MAKVASLGIKRIESVHFYVKSLERARRFFVNTLDFAEIGASSPKLEADGRQTSVLFKAGDCMFYCSEPLAEGGRAWRYLRRHPEGVGTLVFEVEDVKRAFALLESRGGTPITDVQRFEDDGGSLAFFSITTPFGDTTFRFVERRGYRSLFPGVTHYDAPRGGQNRHGFEAIDHVTSNFQTMAPALLWMEHVLGLEPFWEIAFHTEDVASEDRGHGSGLRSRVMWDPQSGVKFANNEPLRPYFKSSQINLFTEDHRGDGVQHLALTVPDILGAVRNLRGAGLQFMPTPGAYYDALPERLKRLGVGQIDEDIALLRELEILVDGDRAQSYLLQIFARDGAGQWKNSEAGPFFFEIIHRKGDRGFGGGNFRALFESIESQQRQDGRL